MSVPFLTSGASCCQMSSAALVYSANVLCARNVRERRVVLYALLMSLFKCLLLIILFFFYSMLTSFFEANFRHSCDVFSSCFVLTDVKILFVSIIIIWMNAFLSFLYILMSARSAGHCL
jgi:hypothetical protein